MLNLIRRASGPFACISNLVAAVSLARPSFRSSLLYQRQREPVVSRCIQIRFCFDCITALVATHIFLSSFYFHSRTHRALDTVYAERLRLCRCVGAAEQTIAHISDRQRMYRLFVLTQAIHSCLRCHTRKPNAKTKNWKQRNKTAHGADTVTFSVSIIQ